MNARRWLLIGSLAVIAGGIVAAVIFRRLEISPPPASQSVSQAAAQPIAVYPPSPPPQDYVGNAACKDCHAAIAQSFATHPMSKSMSVIGGDSTLDTFDQELTIRPGGRCIYRVRQTGDSQLVHDEIALDSSGKPIYQRTVPIHFAMGSGQQGRSYLTNHDGVLLMSSISWYTKGNRWDLSPGYVPDDPRGFNRRVFDECLACHTGRVATRPGSSRYASAPFHQASIGCENCHGPGQKHVDFHTSKSTGMDPIVNPTKLASAERESVCNQCHLQAAARIPRYGRTFFDFRPGQRLDETVTVLVAGEGLSDDGKTKSVSHVQQMMASQCFRQSKGKLGCISCHDPHRVPIESEQAEYYRGRCFECHANSDCGLVLEERLSHKSKNSCFECHMSRLELDVAHAAQTDHRVLAHPEQPSKSDGTVSDRLAFFDGSDKRMPGWEANRAAGLAIIQHTSEIGRIPTFAKVEQLLAGCVKIAPDDTRVTVALAQLAVKTGNLEAAERYATQTLEHDPNHESALAVMVLVCYQMERNHESLAFADRLIAINPMNDVLHAHRADLLRLAGRLPEGIAAAHQALDLNPRLVPLRRWLSMAYEELGDMEKSAEQTAIIKRLEEG